MPSVSTPPRQPQPRPVKEHEPVRDVVIRPRKLKMETLENRVVPGITWSV
jgi:hypothetical protein